MSHPIYWFIQLAAFFAGKKRTSMMYKMIVYVLTMQKKTKIEKTEEKKTYEKNDETCGENCTYWKRV